MGLSSQDKLNIYSTVAAVLHLGNINFEDDPDSNKGGSQVTSTTERSLSVTSTMLGLDARDLRQALTTRTLMTKTTSQNKENIISYVEKHSMENFDSMPLFFEECHSRLMKHRTLVML